MAEFCEEAFDEVMNKSKEYMSALCDIATKYNLNGVAVIGTALNFCELIIRSFVAEMTQNGNEGENETE